MTEVDVNEELRNIENTLRDIISFALNIKYGHDWIDKLKVSDDKKKSWKNKMVEESKRFRGVLIDNRLLYYSEFHDLCNIISNHWDEVFKDIFIEKKQIEVLLDIISSYRVSIAHNRELRDHQKYFLVGASGIIRSLIAEYRADRDNEDSYYPSFQSVFINNLDITNIDDCLKLGKKNYHVGDDIEVSVNVNCPPDIKVKYAIAISKDMFFDFSDKDFTVSNKKRIKLTKEHIPQVNVFVAVKSNQDYHRYKNEDLHEEHYINVLPNKEL